MLKTRVITAILALIPFFWVFLKGDTLTISLFFALLVAISAYELSMMVFAGLYKRLGEAREAPHWLVAFTMLLSVALYTLCVFLNPTALVYVGLVLLLGILFGIFSAPTSELSFAHAVGLVTCVVYSTFPWIAIQALYKEGGDARYIFLLCAIVWSGDTGAYFAGRGLGKHKLAPRMSPNKTWEGAIGGVIASILGALLIMNWYGEGFLSWSLVISMAIFGGIFGQLGDLTESTFKRFAGVKDSGKMLPGHGGFLDRVDGLLFSAPIIWFILFQFGR
jgi:phosphatidate cytidylyltransferase